MLFNPWVDKPMHRSSVDYTDVVSWDALVLITYLRYLPFSAHSMSTMKNPASIANLSLQLIARIQCQVCQRYNSTSPADTKLKGHCIEFKYYADGIYCGLTPPG